MEERSQPHRHHFKRVEDEATALADKIKAATRVRKPRPSRKKIVVAPQPIALNWIPPKKVKE